ncbi:hypothetical protein SAMN06269185_0710 [Natronoarchaeum philippinense]|uniref:Transcription factor zinc-finger n=1 Tax=Natronoarchaeum philippinense TaxID=558529 RepID=A0A285N7J1_NATPI|nr:zf-TFIIB domain-containing protein [Natronoarchaeum philippinense]SNZ04883.1 hypothetical protein SAMN06269185_0710 [Natronoarchaeum philippinense]
MNCPRCSDPLRTYSFRGHQTNGCETCGFVGVAVNHESEPVEIESWQDALDRFKEA